MRKKWLLLVTTYLASFLIVAGLYATAYWQLRQSNKFIRLFPPHMLGKQNRIDLGTNAFYFAGIDKDTLYLANRLDARWIKKIHLPTLTAVDLSIRWPNLQPPFSDWQVSINRGLLSFSNYINGTLLLSAEPFSQPYRITKLPQPLYRTIPIHPQTIFAKSYNSPLKTRSILRLQLDRPLENQSFLPPRKPDGLYSTEGILLWNEANENLVYIHNFINRVTILDSSCTVKATHSTIDWSDSLKGSIIISQQKDNQVQQVESAIVNQLAATDQHLVLVYSKAPASNQPLALFRKNATIDVYQLPAFSYLYSFYLPLAADKHLVDMQLHHQELYVLMGTELIRYQLILPAPIH
jgi:hypothetical protein